jgi:hypothetical protein
MALLRQTAGEMLRFDAAGKNLRDQAVSELNLLKGGAASSRP